MLGLAALFISTRSSRRTGPGPGGGAPGTAAGSTLLDLVTARFYFHVAGSPSQFFFTPPAAAIAPPAGSAFAAASGL